MQHAATDIVPPDAKCRLVVADRDEQLRIVRSVHQIRRPLGM